jgi:hypothetical protein
VVVVILVAVTGFGSPLKLLTALLYLLTALLHLLTALLYLIAP